MGSKDTPEDIKIPVIDISPTNHDAPQQLLDAACRFGFVFVANNEATGIPPKLIEELFDLSKQFFALPTETKQEVSIASNAAGKNHGWLSQGVEKLDPGVQQRPDVKEAFNMSLPSPTGTYAQPLPALLQTPANLQTLNTFQNACGDLCQHLLTLFATSLSLPPTWFTSRHDRTLGPVGSIFRLLYYPHRHHDSIDIRAGAHSDYGSLTCLFQLPGQPGLEIRTPRGEWAPVPVDPLGEGGALPILVNIGDLMQDWTSGLLKSTKHRVVFPKEEAGDRFSIAYFCHPLDEALLEPVPSELVREHEEKVGRKEGKVITAREHLQERLAATYKIK